MNAPFAIRSILMMALAAAGMNSALAQRPVGLPDNYPNKPVRMIIATAPGGATDTCARAVAIGLSQRWGNPVVADNVAGGGGLIGAAAMMRAAPDGYTLMTTASNAYVMAEL